MSDRKAFSEILETLHRGRNKPAEQQGQSGIAAGPQQKGGSSCAPKSTKPRSKTSKPGAREHGKPSTGATGDKPGNNTLDSGDLEQRYGKLKLTSVPQACSAELTSPPAGPQLVPKSCSPMQIQASKELTPISNRQFQPTLRSELGLLILTDLHMQSPDGGAVPARELSPAEAYRAALAAASKPQPPTG